MSLFSRPGKLEWTYHARAKMRFYRLSEARVRRVLHAPKRVEEGIAPNTVALMLPTSTKNVVPRGAQGKPGIFKREETWNQEIWVMMQGNKVISAWRYPGRSKPRSEALKDIMRKEYGEFFAS